MAQKPISSNIVTDEEVGRMLFFAKNINNKYQR